MDNLILPERFCYWSVADGDDHALMMQTCIASARRQGVKEDFHVFSDREIPGAITHIVEPFEHDRYIFKFEFLKNEVSKLNYDYFVFLDADNFFTRYPGDFTRQLRKNKWFAQLESEMTTPLVNRGEWWGCPSRLFPVLLQHQGVKSKRVWNTNAGLFIVRKDAIDEFYEKAMAFYKFCRFELHLVNFTEEPVLAFLAHLVDDPTKNTLAATASTWACDWTGHYRDRLPDGNPWQFEDYMTGEKRNNMNPAIVHAMRSKTAMVNAAKAMNAAMAKTMAIKYDSEKVKE